MFQTTWSSGELAPVVWITPVTATIILSIVTVCMALLQFALKPFEESEEEADGGWRTSPNSQVRTRCSITFSATHSYPICPMAGVNQSMTDNMMRMLLSHRLKLPMDASCW